MHTEPALVRDRQPIGTIIIAYPNESDGGPLKNKGQNIPVLIVHVLLIFSSEPRGFTVGTNSAYTRQRF
jgi:hypothetical protein